jgi:3-isopropylmalate dehydrogenase
MSKRTIVTLPGDGIGKVVLPQALRVLEAAGFDAQYVPADIGWEFWVKEGNALPQRTIDLLERHKTGLFGAITSKSKEKADAELSPALRGKGCTYYSPIVTMRQHFNLDICIRPCVSFPGNPLNFVRQKSGGGYEEPGINAVIFRQNTEGLYAGVEWTSPPEPVRQAFGSHKKWAAFRDVPPADLAVSLRVITRQASERICRAAFEYARRYGYKSVTVCEKPNVLRETSGLFTQAAQRVATDYPGITLRETNIDAQMMWLTKNPEDYGVIVCSNMFGDIVSDAFAGLVGGLGFAASANIGDEVAVFEPTHGSAPKYEQLDPPIVNPIAMILAACMMLDHLGETGRAQRIRGAIAAVVAEGRVRTYDMLRLPGGPDVFKHGAASTMQMVEAIIGRL